MNTKVKITAAVCGMFLATALLLNPAQAERDASAINKQQKVSLTSNSSARYRGECVGNGACMEDSTRVWYGKWHEY